MFVTLDRTAVRVAQSLAGAHGHTWGGTVLPDGPLTEESIRTATQSQMEEGPMGWGWDAPSVRDGYIFHTTGSGRYSWTVSNAGLMTLDWSRPDGGYAVAVVDFSDGADSPPRVWMGEAEKRPTIFARHVWYVVDDLLAATRAVYGVLGTTPDEAELARIQDHVLEQLDPIRVDEIGYLADRVRVAQWHFDNAARRCEWEAEGRVVV